MMRTFNLTLLAAIASFSFVPSASAQMPNPDDLPQVQLEGRTYVLNSFPNYEKNIASIQVERLAPGTMPSEYKRDLTIFSWPTPLEPLSRGEAFETEYYVRFRPEECREATTKGKLLSDGNVISVHADFAAGAFGEECAGAAKGLELRLAFPPLSPTNRIAMGLSPDPAAVRACKMTPPLPLQESLVGRTYTVYPNERGASWQRGQPLILSKIYAYAQTGPTQWQRSNTAVFGLGDKVKVTKQIKYNSSDPAKVYRTLVEVAREGDGETAVVPLEQLVDFDISTCPPSLLLGSKRLQGLHVRVIDGAEILQDGGTWHPDGEAVHYAYCRDSRLGKLGCQVQSHKRKPIVPVTSWYIEDDKVELVTTAPDDVKNF